jgi:hypothetical protein
MEFAIPGENRFQTGGRFADQQGAMNAAIECTTKSNMVRICGPDGLFATWNDGVFQDGNLRDAAVGKPVPPPRHQINRVFRILRREYQRNRAMRKLLISIAQIHGDGL